MIKLVTTTFPYLLRPAFRALPKQPLKIAFKPPAQLPLLKQPKFTPILPRTAQFALTKPLLNIPHQVFAQHFKIPQPLRALPPPPLAQLSLFSLFSSKPADQSEQARAMRILKMDTILKKSPELRSNAEKIELFNYLLERGQEEIKKGENKDIVILFGDTGSGKSTFCNVVYGCKMVEEGGNIVVAPNSKIKEVAKIGTDISSCTFIPQCIPEIEIPSQYDTLTADNNPPNPKTLTLFDMPGLNDNRGIEVALANVIIMKELIDRAKSVRLVMFFEHGRISSRRGSEWIETVKLLEETFAGVVGATPQSLSVIITKGQEDNAALRSRIKSLHGFRGTSLDLSEEAMTYNPLDPNERKKLLNVVSHVTQFRELGPKVSVGPAQLFKAIKLGTEVEEKVSLLLNTGKEEDRIEAVKKVQFTSGLARLGNPDLALAHTHSSNAVHKHINDLLREMEPEKGGLLMAKQIESKEKYIQLKKLLHQYIDFTETDARANRIIDRTVDPRSIAWDKGSTTVKSAAVTTACAIGGIFFPPIWIGAAVGVLATGYGGWNWTSPAEQDKKITAFFKYV